MNKLTETIHTTGNTRRCVQTFSQGIRRVTFDRGGESWTAYMIIPRRALIAGIRKMRQHGAQYHDCDWWTLVPDLDRWFRSAGYGGPGQAFANEPYRYGQSRRFIVMAQSGGLDI